MTLNPEGAKFEVTWFDGTSNFCLWQMRVNDLLAQKSIQKVLRDEKSADIATIHSNEMKEKVASLIRLCVSDDVMIHIVDLTTSKDVLDKLESQHMPKTLMNKLFAK